MGRENSLYAVVTVNSDSYQSLVKTIDCLAIIIKPKWNLAVTQSKASTFSQNNPSFLSNKLKMKYSWTLKTGKKHLHKGVDSRISHLECCLNFLFWFFSVLSVVLIFYHILFLLVFYDFVFYYHQWVIFFFRFPMLWGTAVDSLWFALQPFKVTRHGPFVQKTIRIIIRLDLLRLSRGKTMSTF